ncbi:MAG: CoB--CoM heterodisulfide reductase iron-sulfur subunit A family protein [Chloroflexi bacterium]|nr:CoB--CoM heterodisulfide reductase iron-sulfur subunit A family protein [Chloroflexota bacterium]
MSRIGVFVCHCGHNIAGVVDVAAVAREVELHDQVVFATDYKYMCSDPGQQLIKDSIKAYNLDGVVVAACSPAMHETTFRRAVASVGMNPFRFESANIREQCSWVHQDEPEAATAKAIAITRSIIEKVSKNEELSELKFSVNRSALVIGGGIAGMQAALDIADAGFPVTLIEKQSVLGGNMAKLSGSYLNFRAAPDLLQKMVERVQQHPQIRVLTRTQVRESAGYIGNFQITLDVLTEEDNPKIEKIDVGAVVVATGWHPYDPSLLPEYGSGEIPDVIDGLAFETMLRDNNVRRPSDGKIPQEIVFVQCAGSRDREHGVSYCSKVCCMYVAKQAMMYRELVPYGQAYVFYIDIRSAGKGYDEYVQRAMTDHQVLYLRGKVSKVFEDGNKVIVWGADTLTDRAVEVAADLVVLATPMYPAEGAIDLGQRLHISSDAYGFYNEAHIKLRPVETLTAGIFLAGTAQGPKDIPETSAQASGAAAKVLQMFSNEEMTLSPLVATVIQELCSACGACVKACPYEARQIHPVWNYATVNASLCQSCGACVTACPNKASQVHNWRPNQILAMLDEVV